MESSLKVAFMYWILRGKGCLLPKTPKKELLALTAWKKHKKTNKKSRWDLNSQPLGCESVLLTTGPQGGHKKTSF